MRYLKNTATIVVITLILLSIGSGTLRLSPIERSAAPYLYSIFSWEIGNLPDKWVHKFTNLFPWNSETQEERIENLMTFFEMGEGIRTLERQLASLQRAQQPAGPTGGHLATATSPDQEEELISRRLKDLRKERSKLKRGIEETLESEISSILADMGFSYPLGLIFPPVDVALTSPPKVLIVSPRDRIEQIETLLLKPGMPLDDIEELEDKIFVEQNLSVLVEGIGGVATFPTIVREDSSLRHAAITAAHEWLHTYWFFRPLGWNHWKDAQMTSLNETAADLAGRELGQLVYSAITGEEIEEPVTAGESGEAQLEPEVDPDGFDFTTEMRKTRLRVEELLAEGKVVEAEEYMEARRRILEENGFFIRKLNQAFFAFHGTYANSAASISPIGEQVKLVRKVSDSTEDFIKTMSQFGSYQEFKEYIAGFDDKDDIRELANLGIVAEESL